MADIINIIYGILASEELASFLIVCLGSLAARIYLGKNILRCPYIDEKKNLHLGFVDAFVYGGVAWLAYLIKFDGVLNIWYALLFGFSARGIVGAIEYLLHRSGIKLKMF